MFDCLVVPTSSYLRLWFLVFVSVSNLCFCHRLLRITSSVSIWIDALSLISASEIAGFLTSESLKELAHNPLRKASTRISSFGLEILVLASQKWFMYSRSDSFDPYFMSKRSAIHGGFTLFVMNRSINNRAKTGKDVMVALGIPPNHLRAPLVGVLLSNLVSPIMGFLYS